jgi:hypothetical protein
MSKLGVLLDTTGQMNTGAQFEFCVTSHPFKLPNVFSSWRYVVDETSRLPDMAFELSELEACW